MVVQWQQVEGHWWSEEEEVEGWKGGDKWIEIKLNKKRWWEAQV